MGFISDLTGDTATAKAPASSSGFIADLKAPAVPAKPTASPDDLFKGIAKPLDTSGSKIAENLSPGSTAITAPVKPANTSNVFQKFLGGISSAAGKVSDTINSAITPPKQKDVGKNTFVDTLKFLPSELARQIPGVAELQDDPSVTDHLDNSDFVKAVPTAIGQTAAAIAKAPITALADAWDLVRTNMHKAPNASFDIPGLGKVTSDQIVAAQRIQAGEDPVAVAISQGSSAIFNTLFFADVVVRASSARPVTRAKTITDANNLPKTGDQYRAPIDNGPKSGRLYEPKSVYNQGGAQVLPPEVVAQMKAQGINLGEKFDPKLPTFFKVTEGKGGKFTGEVVQLKPSYLNSAYSKLFGKTPPAETLPGLLGAGNPAPNPQELAPIIAKATPEDTVTLHSETVKGGDIAHSLNKQASSVPIPKPETPILPPAPPSTSHVIAHNALRLAGGDTSKAQDFGKILITETQKAIQEHGEDVTLHTAIEKLGMSPEHAAQLIKEAKNNLPVKNIRKPIDTRTDEAITADSAAHVEKNLPDLVQKYIETHGNVVGADEAKELIPGYSNDRSTSDLVQKAAGKIADAAYEHLLEANQGTKNNTVLITAGGTGAGKSTALSSGGYDTKAYSVVFDTNLSNTGGAYKRIEEALSKGYIVHIAFVYAPVREAYNRVLGRSEEMVQKYGSGRPVSAQGHIDMHHGSYDAMHDILSKYGNNKNVVIDILDNTSKETKLIEHNLDFISNVRDNKEHETTLHPGLNEARLQAHQEGRISERANTAFERAEGLRPRKVESGTASTLPESSEVSRQGSENEAGGQAESVLDTAPKESILPHPGGFIDVGAIVDSADAQVKDFIEKTMVPIALSDNVSDSFAKLEGAAQADLETINKIIKDLPINAADDEALYYAAEDPNHPLTAAQRELKEKFDTPFQKINQALFERIKNDGTPLPDEGTYIARFAKDRPSVVQRILDPGSRGASSKQGSILSKSTPSFKKRVMKAVVDASGKRTVVSIKDGQVTAFRNKAQTPLGPLEKKVTTKVNEFFDPAVRMELEKLAASLGIRHERVPTGQSKGLGTGTAGVSFTGRDLIKTRLSHDSVLAHEIGHQIDDKYGLQAVIKDAQGYGPERKKLIQDEMRALADKRFEGGAPNKTFTKYVRKGSEKMAVMFEAYISNRAMFQKTAPHLYDDFRDFLASHEELKPFLDIEGSVRLGATQHGGEHVAGKSGSTFIDKNGKHYTITDATTKEIEQHTDLEYYHSAISSRLMQYIKLRQIDRANQFMESWKASKDFEKIAVKSDEVPPDGWKMTTQVNFRNYYFEPRMAEVLDDLQKQMDSGNYNNAFTGINRALANAIFFNGLAHPINVLVIHTVNRGVSGLIYPPQVASGLRAGVRALKALSEKNEDYMELLRNGAHLMSSDVNSQKVAENIAQKLNDELGEKPDLRDRLLRALGYTLGQASFKTNIVYKLSHDMAWLSNDFFTMQSIFETMETRGMSMADAVKETSRFIPDYRQKPRLLDKPLSAVGKLVGNQEAGGNTARFIAKSVVYNSLVSMFGSYHVGLLEGLKNIVTDTGKGTDWTFSQESNTQRLKSADKLVMLMLFMAVIYPWLDSLAKKAFGATSYITRSGITKYPYLAYKLATGEATPSQAAQQIITPAVLVWEALQQFTDHDFFTGNQISGPGNEGRINHALNAVAPFVEFQRVATGKSTMAEFGATLLGVHTPKNTQLAYSLNTMLYDEKPKVLTEAKKHIAAGDEAGALQIVEEFNSRLVDSIRANDIASNGATTDERVAYFFNQYGLKMPGEKAVANYEARLGQNIVQRTLPNGQPVIVHDTPVPATGVIGAITTYAKAIGTDPVEAFGIIFSGQTIKNVENGAIIVNRMSLAQSEAIKKAGGGNNPNFKLDHIVPLEGGGDNSDSNLQLIPTAEWQGNTNVENFIGASLKNGTMTKDQAREIAIRFKAGQGELLSPAILKEYETKYGSKPLTEQEVYNFSNVLDK